MTGIQGGTVYDAILLKAAVKAHTDRLYTLNLRHFLALAPSGLAPKIAAP